MNVLTEMGMKLGIFVILLSLSSIVSQTPPSNSSSPEESGGIDWWCNNTPHPEVCKYFMCRARHRLKPQHRSDFRKMTVQIAIAQVHSAKKHAKHLRHRCHSKRQKAVLKDCYKLLDNTVLQLNRTLQSFRANKTSDFDAQTWLSTSLTYLETCRSGSQELNVSSFISPIFSTNVSQLLSNSLAVNGELMKPPPSSSSDDELSGYPTWVTSGVRKLLQTSSSLAISRANVIVAQDGSGQFRSIQAAINYATSRRVGNGRVVIYIKRGVYRENIAISSTMNKVMLIGDGSRYTVITGSRSVAGGYTTYSSATVGKAKVFLIIISLNLPFTHPRKLSF